MWCFHENTAKQVLLFHQFTTLLNVGQGAGTYLCAFICAEVEFEREFIVCGTEASTKTMINSRAQST